MGEVKSARTAGVGLGIGAQATLMAAWLVGVVGALSQSDVGLLGGVLGLIGLVLMIVACFLLRPRWGVFGPIAAAIFIAGILGAVIAFIAVPGTREWGKLGAFILATLILAGAWVLGHLFASIGLLRAGVTAVGAAAVTVQVATAVMLALSGLAGTELWLFACGGAFVGHALLVIGLARMGSTGVAQS